MWVVAACVGGVCVWVVVACVGGGSLCGWCGVWVVAACVGGAGVDKGNLWCSKWMIVSPNATSSTYCPLGSPFMYISSAHDPTILFTG